MVYVGQIVNTHGIKGEVRIISDFKYKQLVFKKGFTIYIGKKHEPLIINTYRIHKNYDMLTFNDITDINDVLCYKGENVYINREDIEIDGFVNEDIIGLSVYSKDKLIGTVSDIINNGAQDIIVIKGNNTNLVPFVDEFIEKIDINSKKIFIREIEGLLNED